jgi:hypothetical protein
MFRAGHVDAGCCMRTGRSGVETPKIVVLQKSPMLAQSDPYNSNSYKYVNLEDPPSFFAP